MTDTASSSFLLETVMRLQLSLCGIPAGMWKVPAQGIAPLAANSSGDHAKHAEVSDPNRVVALL